MKGGYKVIDFKKFGAFTSGTEKDDCTGIYKAIESTNKVILVEGLTIGTTEWDAFYVVFEVVSSAFKTTVKTFAGTISIVVAEDDGVTITYTAD